MAILTVMMQALVRRATGFTWAAMLAPQIPGATCALLLAVVVFGTGMALRAMLPEPALLVLLVGQATAGALFYAAFVLFCPFASVRDVVAETLDDMLPAKWLAAVNWLRRPSQA